MKKILKYGDLTRIHMVNPSHKDIDEISTIHDFHEIIEQDMKEANTQDKIDIYDDYVFVVLHFSKYDENLQKHNSNEFNFVLGKNFIASIARYNTDQIEIIRSNYIDDMKKDLDNDEIHTRTSPYYILYKIIDSMYDKTILGLDKFNKDVNKTQSEIFDGNIMQTKFLENLLIKSRNVVILENIFSPHEEIIKGLDNIKIKFYESKFSVYFEDLQYKANKINNLIITLDNNIDNISNKYNTLVTLKTNSVISLLTIVTVIVGILTLITGFYGMNVNLPGQNIGGMSYLLFGIMFCIMLFMLRIFKKKGIF